MADSPDVIAQEKLHKARANLFLNYPFFGSILMKLSLIEAKWLPTLATNGVSVYYNPEFVKGLSQDQVVTALAHEATHVAMGHPLRHGMFVKYKEMTNEEQQKYTTKMNMAFDYAINPLLVDSGRSEIKDWLCEDQYRGMSAEEIYKKLPDPPPSKHSHSFKIGKDGLPQPGQGCPQCGGGKGEQFGGIGKAGGDKKQPCGGLLPHPASNGTEAEQAEADANRRSMVAGAATLAKMCGNLPAGLEELVDGMLNPRVDWVDQLRRFIEIAAKSDYNWTHPNRRYTGGSVILPSLLSKEAGTIVVAVDTSGSIGTDLLEMFCSEISAMLELVRPEKIIVLHADAQVSNVQEFEPSDLPIRLEVVGRGGTDFNPVFEWVKENDIHPVALVYLTDLYGPYPATAPDYPVLWAIEPAGAKEDPTWGEVIRIQ